jgi:hypothetical protein
MMELFIYSDSEAVRELFRGINRSKHYRTTFLPREELREAAFCTMDGVLIYLDLSGHDRRSFRKEIRFLASHGCAWGVADPDGIVDDPAELFHLGASDYLSPVQMKERIKTARIHRVVEFRGEILETERESSELSSEYLPQGVQLIPSGTDWSAVRKGQEYTFFFLYIELLPGEEWKVKSGDQNRQDIQARFEQFVRRRVTSANGEIWMWSEWGGVVLFGWTAWSTTASPCTWATPSTTSGATPARSSPMTSTSFSTWEKGARRKTAST